MTINVPAKKITDEAIEGLRREIGIETSLPQFNTAATEDAIRHYALGCGDDNPRYCDPDFKGDGGPAAPSTFVLSCGFPRSRGLPGIHGLFTGIDLHCHVPIRVGTRIKASTALHDLRQRDGQYAGRQFQQTYATRYRDENGQVLSTLYSHAFRVERAEGKSRKKYDGLERKSYTDEDLAEIEAAYDREPAARRGANPRYWDDVAVGEPMPAMVKGPLTITDNICFLIGFGYVFVRAHRQWHEFRKRHPGAGVKDRHGVWDVPERVHWDEDLAREIGMPGPYDYGPQRIAWFDHAVSDWMGDAGFTRRLSVQLTAPNFVGDTTWIRGEVTGRNDDGSVVLTMQAVDHRGRVTATGHAEVVLPRK
jgi:acyl dehydratase